MKRDCLFKYASIAVIVCWLTFFALVPNLLVLVTSFLSSESTESVSWSFTYQHYLELFNPLYLKIFLRSLWIASICTAICLAIAYPFAYFLSVLKNRWKPILLILVVIPFWTSSLIRTYAIVAILKTRGIVNSVLLALHIIQQPLLMLYTSAAVIVGLVYSLLPFMILPLYASIEQLDTRLIDAARDLGASKPRIFFRIILPLTVPGVVAGVTLVFLPAMSLFYIPDILGGAKSFLVGNLIQNQFLTAHNWSTGSAVSVLLTLLMSVMLLIYWRSQKNKKLLQALS